MNQRNTTFDLPDLAALRGEYLDAVERACYSKDSDDVRKLVWDRLNHAAGPPLNPRNEDAVILLNHVLAALPPQHVTFLARAAYDEFLDRLQTPSGDLHADALSQLAEFLEYAHKANATLALERLGAGIGALVTNSSLTPLAIQLHGIRTVGGRLLSDVIRVLALFTSKLEFADEWRVLALCQDIPNAAVPAFLGYCRSVGTRAADALPVVARSLADRNRPDTLAVTLKAFVSTGYPDGSSCSRTDSLTEDTFTDLFRRIPEEPEKKIAFIDDTFTTLRALKFPGDGVDSWELIAAQSEPSDVLFARLLTTDIGRQVVPTFRALVRATGQDARLALPLVARTLAARGDNGEELASVVSAFSLGHDLIPADRNRNYDRSRFDAGDSRVLFSLVHPGKRAIYQKGVLAALAKSPTQLQGIDRVEEIAGVLGDAVDSLTFVRQPVIHALLAPLLAQVDRPAFDRLVGACLKSEPVRRSHLSFSAVRVEYAVADRFLYNPGPALKSHAVRVRNTIQTLPCRFATPGPAISAWPEGGKTLELHPHEEAAILPIVLQPGPSDITSSSEAVATAVGVVARSITSELPSRPMTVDLEQTILFHMESPAASWSLEPWRFALRPIAPPPSLVGRYRPKVGKQVDMTTAWSWAKTLVVTQWNRSHVPRGVYRDVQSGGLCYCQSLS